MVLKFSILDNTYLEFYFVNCSFYLFQRSLFKFGQYYFSSEKMLILISA